MRQMPKNNHQSNSLTKGANELPFEDIYWRDIYGDGLDVDGTFNAREHALYLHSLFKLMNVKINSICDIGFGKGVLLKEFARTFKPSKILAIDPSKQMVNELIAKVWVKKYNIAVRHGTIDHFNGHYTLTIFNSVAQYIAVDDLQFIFKKLAKFSQFIYFSVPTINDYKRMKNEIDFEDPYAFKQSKKKYLAAIRPYFNIVSYNLLEKKKSSTAFNDEMFLF